MRIDTILLLYNRPEHALAVVDSLIQNGVQRVRAFLDHADDPAVQLRQEQMLAAIAERRELTLDLHRHEQRMGLARSVRFALHTTLEEADAAIVLEDDCVLRPGGMAFFQEGLEALRYNRRIRSVCGYLYPCPFFRGDTSPLLLRRFCPWGWATWRDRWRDYDPDIAKAVQLLEARKVNLADLAGDLAELCRTEAYLENRVDIWSVPWTLAHYATGTFCVYPCDSMIENIGFDGSGQNCVPVNAFTTTAVSARRAWNWEQLVHLVENEEIVKNFMDRHGLSTYPPPLK
jgi:hypothetical protein